MGIRETPDQGERSGESGARVLRTVARHARMGERPYRYVEQLGDAGAGLDAYGGHLFVTGAPPTHEQLIRRYAGTPGVELYLAGHWPVVHLPGLTITWAAPWWGVGTNPARCDRAHRFLVDELRRAFDLGDEWGLMLTPATTGRDLWARTIPAGRGFPVLSEQAQRMIRSTTGQGRTQTLPAPDGAGPATVHLYDARLAYSACLRGLPIGEPELLDVDRQLVDVDHAGFDVYRPARYRLAGFRAPAGWRLPGILPMATDDGWRWPLTSDGAERDVWVDGAELRLALVHGWTVDVLDALVFPTRGDVFRTWADRLWRVLESPRLARAALDEPWLPGVIRTGVRNLLIHAIGAFQGRPQRRTHIGTHADAPLDAPGADIRFYPGGVATWITEHAPAWPQMVHPEWTAAVWARARTRLLSTSGVGALHLEPGTVVAFRTDALLTTVPVDWPDDGRRGQYSYRGSARMDRWPAEHSKAAELLVDACKANGR